MPSSRSDALSLYPPADLDARVALLQGIRTTPIAFGFWRDLKNLYKRAEADPDVEPIVLGALIARLDNAHVASADEAVRVQTGRVSNVTAVAVAGDRVVIAGGRYGYADTLAVLDMSGPDPMKPKMLGSVSVQAGQEIVTCGEAVCLMGGRWGAPALEFYTLDASGKPVKRSAIPIRGDSAAVDARFPYVYLCTSGRGRQPSGLQIIDLSEPERPVTLGQVDVPMAAGSAVTDDQTLALVASAGTGFSWSSLPKPSGIRIVRIDDKRKPRVIASIEVSDLRAGEIVGNYAYIGVAAEAKRQPAGIQVIDISRPDRPVKGAFVPFGANQIYAIKSYKGHLYATDGEGHTYVLDLSDPAQPRVTGHLPSLMVNRSAQLGDYLLAASRGALQIASIADPARPFLVGQPPSAKTLAYLKRRARRLLRRMVQTEPERFVETAVETLLAVGKESKTLDPARHWATFDLLYGRSKRFVQARHGRGHLRESAAAAPRLRLRTREERAPEAWNRFPDHLKALTQEASLPWQIHEMAIRALRAQGDITVTFPDAVLETYLRSESPLLAAIATRRVSERLESGKTIKPAVAADAYLLSGAARRRRMEPLIRRAAGDAAWAGRYVARTIERLEETRTAGWRRRHRGALRFLAAAARGVGEPQKHPALLAAALATGEAEIVGWAQDLLRRMPLRGVLQMLEQLAQIDASYREAGVSALAEALTAQVYDIGPARTAVGNYMDWVREAAWRMIAASATPPNTLRDLWLGLIDSPFETPALRTAMRSSYALVLLGRAGITSEEIAERLQARPFLVHLLAPETFRSITQTVPAAVILQLVALMPDELWQQLRPAWVANLREGIGVADLWLSAETAVCNDPEGRLAVRILEDDEIARTILGVEDADRLLAITEPAFDAPLRRWAEAHAERLARDSEALLLAATHMLPSVRAWALERVGRLGMEMAFALRLLESEVPPSVVAGRAFFESVSDAARERDWALALCDSPSKSVRAFGREYVQARWERLPHESMLQALYENPDPQMQAFVARLLEAEALRPDGTVEFDREVLRTRNRGRRAKETVKVRQTSEASLDTATLLDLARSRTPRDAEWALSELARRAIAGEAVDGLIVEGTAGV